MSTAPPEAETPTEPKKRPAAKKAAATPAADTVASYDDHQSLRLQALKDANQLLNDGNTRPLGSELVALAEWILSRHTAKADHEPVDGAWAEAAPPLTFINPSITTPEGTNA